MAILDAPILAKLPDPLNPSKPKPAQTIPALIPIRDSPLFKKSISQQKVQPEPQFISDFLRDFDEKNHRTVSLESINMNQDGVSFCSDENFGQLHYSDSE